MLRRTWWLAIFVLLGGGCFSARAMRAPVSDCSLECHDPRASASEQIMCLESCNGAHFGEPPCDPEERADTVCVVEDLDETARRDDPHGVGEAIGLALGVLASIGLAVLMATD
jgi:hypothetical protein